MNWRTLAHRGTIPVLVVGASAAAVGLGHAAPALLLGLLLATAGVAWVGRADVSIAVTAYVVVVLVVPSRYTIGPFAITAAMVVALFAVGLHVYDRATRIPAAKPGRRSQIVVALVAFGVAMLISYTISHYSILSKAQAAGADRNLTRLFAAIAIGVVAAQGLRSRRQLDRAVWALVISAAVVGVIGILQYTAGVSIENAIRPPAFTAEPDFGFIEERGGLNRIAGTARHPIEMSVVWAGLLPVGMHVAWYGRRVLHRRVAFLCTATVAAALLMSLSRSGLAGAAAGLIVYSLAWSGLRRLVFSIVLALGFVSMPFFVPDLFTVLAGIVSGDVGSGSLEARETANAEAFKLASESFLVGRGFGTFDSLEFFHVGNTYLEMLIDVGLLGLVAFALMLIACLLRARVTRREADDPSLGDLVQAFSGGVVAISLGGWGLNIFRYPMMMGVFFLLLGLIGTVDRLSHTGDAVAGGLVRAGGPARQRAQARRVGS